MASNSDSRRSVTQSLRKSKSNSNSSSRLFKPTAASKARQRGAHVNDSVTTTAPQPKLTREERKQRRLANEFHSLRLSGSSRAQETVRTRKKPMTTKVLQKKKNTLLQNLRNNISRKHNQNGDDTGPGSESTTTQSVTAAAAADSEAATDSSVESPAAPGPAPGPGPPDAPASSSPSPSPSPSPSSTC
jgi:hypothetical protein